MSVYSSLDVYPSSFDEIDLTPCENCDFGFCGEIELCVKKHGEGYILNSLMISKGYTQCNIDSAYIDKKHVRGFELYRKESKKFIKNMEKLGYSCRIHDFIFQKKYLATIFVEGYDPMDLVLDLLKLDVIS